MDEANTQGLWHQREECALIRLQRIYNFLLFHAILYSVLDV